MWKRFQSSTDLEVAAQAKPRLDCHRSRAGKIRTHANSKLNLHTLRAYTRLAQPASSRIELVIYLCHAWCAFECVRRTRCVRAPSACTRRTSADTPGVKVRDGEGLNVPVVNAIFRMSDACRNAGSVAARDQRERDVCLSSARATTASLRRPFHKKTMPRCAERTGAEASTIRL